MYKVYANILRAHFFENERLYKSNWKKKKQKKKTRNFCKQLIEFENTNIFSTFECVLNFNLDITVHIWKRKCIWKDDLFMITNSNSIIKYVK